jgi:hypothetical protein
MLEWLVSEHKEGKERRTPITYRWGLTTRSIRGVIPLSSWVPCGPRENIETGKLVASEERCVLCFEIKYRHSAGWKSILPWYKRLTGFCRIQAINRKLRRGWQ